MDYKRVSENFAREIASLFSSKQEISEREDSRAFGAMIEQTIKGHWLTICANLGYQAIEIPGKKTIYDVACNVENTLLGFDVKTKDLDVKRYSDGGVCAVGNLLKFLANDKGVFMIVEFGHEKSKNIETRRTLKYIRVAPFHCLPTKVYRIENLGTGQVRLNHTINEVWTEIDWNRPYHAFFDIFCNLAIAHYKRVKVVAEKRIRSIETFKENGYTKFHFIK